MARWTIDGPRQVSFDERVELCPEGHIAGEHTAHGRLGAGTGRLSATAISGNIALLARPVENEERS